MGNKGAKEKEEKEHKGEDPRSSLPPPHVEELRKEAEEIIDKILREYQKNKEADTKDNDETEKEKETEGKNKKSKKRKKKSNKHKKNNKPPQWIHLNALKRKAVSKIPEGIFQLHDLVSLNLAYNRIEKFPAQISELQSLTELRCNNNILAKWGQDDWAPTLHTLTNLKTLILSRNGIRLLPPSFCSLVALEHLDLHSNALAGLPEDMGKLQALRYLDISENQYIVKLPPSMVLDEELKGMTALTELNLSVNRTANFPQGFIGSLVNLTSFKCSGNHLTHLPKEISKLTNLTILDLSLSKLSKFPKSVCSLPSLTLLDLNVMDTKKMKIPSTLSRLSNLRTLHLRWNTLSDTDCKRIAESLPGLVELELGGCKLKADMPSLSSLTSLTALDLSFNEFEEMPEWIADMTWLQRLALYHNNEGDELTPVPLKSIYTPVLPLISESPALKWYPVKLKGKHRLEAPEDVRVKEGATKLSNAELRDKIYGCIFGHAVGDAIGLSTEFLNRQQANVNYGSQVLHYTDFIRDRHRARWLFGDFTDDTDQMILILDNLLSNGGHVDIPSYALSLLRWAKQGFYELGDDGGMGLGSTVGAVIFSESFLDHPHETAHKIWLSRDKDAAANGAVMRTSVLGVVNFDDTEKVKENTRQISKVTHVDTRCVASCIAVTVAIALMLRGETENIMEQALEEALKEDFSVLKTPEKSIEEFKAAVSATTFEELKLDESNAIGYTLKCVGSGFVALRYDSFEDALMYVAREAGDSDTNGAVCGALLGTKLGFGSLPHEWVEGMPHRKWLAHKAELLCSLLGV